MTNLKEELHKNYETHPEFFLSGSRWTVRSKDILDFDFSYKSLWALKKESDFIGAENKLLLLIDVIFQFMKNQTNNRFEELFLDELRYFCKEEILIHVAYKLSQANSSIPRNTSYKLSPFEHKLNNDYHFFGALRPSATTKILEYAKASLTLLQNNADSGRLSRSDLSTNSDQCIRNITNILNREFKKNGTLKALSEYMGSNYFVSGMAIELSVPNSSWWRSNYSEDSPSPKTMYAHIDQSIIFPKAILYLTNVDLSNGPTSCYPGIFKELHLNSLQEIIGRVIEQVGRGRESPLRSYYSRSSDQTMSSQKFRLHFMKLPTELQFNSHLGWDILSGSNVEKLFIDKEVFMTGPPGTFIVFDGSKLFHRGGMLENGKRIVLQIMFAPKPKLFDQMKNLPYRGYIKLKKFLK